MLPNTQHDINFSELDPTKCYFQVIFVQPYFDRDQLEHRISIFDQQFNISIISIF